MTQEKSDAKKFTKNMDSINEGFQKVLRDHGISSLRVSGFSISPTANESNLTAATTDTQGCWKVICKTMPGGVKVCQEVWVPDC